MKRLILSFAFALVAFVGFSQAPPAADVAHTVTLNIQSVMEIEEDTTTGATTDETFTFSSVEDLNNGKESENAKKILLHSNKNWKVQVRAASENFSFTPAETGVTYDLACGNLSVKEGTSEYQALTTTAADIKTGSRGKTTLEVKYKADPGFEAPAGTYTLDVEYSISAQ